MNRFHELFLKPLPHLTAGKAFLLRLLMLPNLIFVRIEEGETLSSAPTGPCIFAFNHNNVIESLFVPVYLMYLLGGRKISFVVDWMFGQLPLIGRILSHIDPVYVYHKRASLPIIERKRPQTRPDSTVEQCCARLDAGIDIGIFPEGTRNHDPYRLLRGRPGIGHIVLSAGVPVVPVGIDFPVSRRLNRAPFAGRMILRFGRAMHFSDESMLYRQLAGEKPDTEMNRLAQSVTSRVMHALSGLCGKSMCHDSECCKCIS